MATFISLSPFFDSFASNPFQLNPASGVQSPAISEVRDFVTPPGLPFEAPHELRANLLAMTPHRRSGWMRLGG